MTAPRFNLNHSFSHTFQRIGAACLAASTLLALPLAPSAWAGVNRGIQSNVTTEKPLQPTVLTHRVNPLESVDSVSLPALDLAALAMEDQDRADQGLPPRYAIPYAVSITPKDHGTWEQIDANTMLWRYRIQCDAAKTINLGFTQYHMPAGGHLFIYAADQSEVIRAFTNADNADHGQLWTPMVHTDDLVVEVTLPKKSVDLLDLKIGQIGHGYLGFDDMAIMFSGACNVDVVCPQGDAWRNEIPAVGVISTGGATFCTGFMVNNVRGDRTPYFMTANHCGINLGNAPSLVVFWNYETSICGGAPNGTLTQFSTGSTFKAGYGPSDFTLVQLTTPPPSSFGVTFAGWDATGVDHPSAVGIHHPNTDEKRISFENNPITTTTYLQNAVPGDGTHHRITQWDVGTTEPGSSGSPLFSPNHQVIGQLHGGFASCTSLTSDWYGKFSASWVGGGVSGTRLSDWLDPDATGALTVGTIGNGMSTTPSASVSHLGDVGGPFTNPSTTYTLSNGTGSTLNYSVALTTNFGILLNGGTAPLSGSLLNGASVNVIVTLGPAINTLPVGVFNETIAFTDITNTITTNVPHTVEVGQTLVDVTPAIGFDSGGALGGPFTSTQAYTVTSQRPTTTNIQASADQPWISLNGSAGPVSATLVGIGDFSVVTVGISAAANSLPAGLQTGSVTFTNLNDGSFVTRPVTLDVGRLVFTSTDTPIAIPDNTPAGISSVIIVPDSFCIGDVDVDLDITHTFIGDLLVNLIAPDGTSITLHNETGGGAANLVVSYDDEAGIPADGPGALTDLDGLESLGAWTLHVSDNAGADVGTLNSWTLKIAPNAIQPCPTPQVIHTESFDINPGWAVTGQWAFGQPTGGAGSSGGGDPLGGFTGLNVYGYNLLGGYPNNMAVTEYLTSTPFDLTGATGTKLRFRRWLGVESASFDHANIQLSTDGLTWTPIWDHTGGSINDTTWILQTIDISALADNQPSVSFRWGMGPTDGSVTYHGWNIDDLEIIGLPTAAPCPADITPAGGNGTVNIDDLVAVLNAFGPCPGCPADITPPGGNGVVNIDDLVAVLNAFGACP